MDSLKKTSLALVFLMLVAGAPLPADAHRSWNHGNHHHDWSHGRWHHGYYGATFGWWWVTAGAWHLYPYPVYPYPDQYAPPVVIVQQSAPPVQIPQLQPQPQFWYYCESAAGYYPYVPACAEEWKRVPVTPPAVAPVR